MQVVISVLHDKTFLNISKGVTMLESQGHGSSWNHGENRFSFRIGHFLDTLSTTIQRVTSVHQKIFLAIPIDRLDLKIKVIGVYDDTKKMGFFDNIGNFFQRRSTPQTWTLIQYCCNISKRASQKMPVCLTLSRSRVVPKKMQNLNFLVKLFLLTNYMQLSNKTWTVSGYSFGWPLMQVKVTEPDGKVFFSFLSISLYLFIIACTTTIWHTEGTQDEL